MTRSWKLLLDGRPLDGALNMAVDDYLFSRLPESSETYVRFYRWTRPTVSLGYYQDATKVVNLEACRLRGVGVVRRMTGGKLVLHDAEVTYSVASSDSGVFSTGLKESYRLISRALLAGLDKMGLHARLAESSPPSYAKGNLPCFSHPARDEVEIQGKKIIGSAQKRMGAKFIQHGSIPLRTDPALLKAVSRVGEREPEVSMTSLSEALGRPVDFEEAASRFAAGFSEFFGVRLESLTIEGEEWERVLRIRGEKYGLDTWTFRKPGL
ncbi:MAG: biotin/lipoate A/B protein ligase family protein [Acidobacteriota bacterium]|nr:biotin/lipoate A/B protein ligase family protein [Acidobacteriota bacterium]